VKGLALSGGAARGSFQIGALEYLYKVRKYRADVIASTSVGSINGIALAQADKPDEQVKRLDLLLRIWRGLARPQDFYTLRPWAEAMLQTDSIDLGALSIDEPHVVEQIVFNNLIGNAKASPSIALLDPLESLMRPLVDPKKLAKGVPLRMVTVSLESGRIRYVTERGFLLEDDNRTPVASALPDDPRIKPERDAFLSELAMLRNTQAQADMVSHQMNSPGKWKALARLRLELDRARWRTDTAFDALAARNASLPKPVQAPVDPVNGALASSGLPGIFGPYRLGEERYVDGGVREQVPVRTVIQMGATEVVAVATSSQEMPHSGAASEESFFMVLFESLTSLMQREIVEQDIAGRGTGNVPVTVIMPTLDVHDGAVVDMGLIHMAMDYGYMRAADVLDPLSDSDRAAARRLSDAITALRRETHLLSYMWTWPIQPGDHQVLDDLRFRKWVIRKLVESRVASGVGIPRFAALWFQTWEDGASAVPFIPTPWGRWVTTGDMTPAVAPYDYLPDSVGYEEKGDLEGMYVVRQGATFRGNEAAVLAITGAGSRPAVVVPAGTSANLPKVPTPGTVLAETAAAGSPVVTPGAWVVDAKRRYVLNAAALTKLGSPTPLSVPGGSLAQIPSGGTPYWLGGLVQADSHPAITHEWDPSPLSEASRAKTGLYLWNNGSTGRTTTVTGIAITTPADMPARPVFTVDTPLPREVPQNRVILVDVTFDAHTPGALQGFVSITCDDPIAPTFSIPLVSSVAPLGAHAQIQVTPGQLDLGSALVGMTTGATLQITNTGTVDGGIAAAVVDDQPAAQFAVPSAPPVNPLPPGATTSMNVLFEPTARGAARATVAIDMGSRTAAGAFFQQRVEVPVSAVGTAPIVFLADGPPPAGPHRRLPQELTALDFGTAGLNTQVAKSFWIWNIGDAPLTVHGVAITGLGAVTFVNFSMFPLTLGTNGDVEVQCSFNSGAVAGANNHGELEIQSDDPLRPTAFLQALLRAAGPHLHIPGELLDLGQVPAQATGTLTYTSDGSDPVTIKSVTLASGVDFAVSTQPTVPASIAPGDPFLVTIRVTGTTPGLHIDRLEMVHNSAPNGLATAEIRADEAP
jgi:NTE family protein